MKIPFDNERRKPPCALDRTKTRTEDGENGLPRELVLAALIILTAAVMLAGNLRTVATYAGLF